MIYGVLLHGGEMRDDAVYSVGCFCSSSRFGLPTGALGRYVGVVVVVVIVITRTGEGVSRRMLLSLEACAIRHSMRLCR